MAPPVGDGLLLYAAHACGGGNSYGYFLKVDYL
jgi:hypothetical protein